MIDVRVSNRLLDRCRDWGEGIVASYSAGHNERSRLCGFNKRRIDGNPIEQMYGKIGEVAAAVALGLDPDDDLKWDHCSADFGWDLVLRSRKFDVKTTAHPRGRYLIWPASKASFFDEVAFDGMLFVWAADCNSDRLGYCEVRGWCSKAEFKEHHIVASASTCTGLIPGTMYLPQDRLRRMAPLMDWGRAA